MGQVFHWDFTVNRFLFLLVVSSTSSDSEMSFYSEGSKIYDIAELGTEENDDSRLLTPLT